MNAAELQLEWFGCTTFRVRVDGLTLFFDTYVDRPPGLPAVGLAARDVHEADFVFVSHAHFDHMLGVDTIANATGATVVCSYEVARVLRANGVPDAQVAELLGHSGAAMLHRHYAHLTARARVLKEALGRVR